MFVPLSSSPWSGSRRNSCQCCNDADSNINHQEQVEAGEAIRVAALIGLQSDEVKNPIQVGQLLARNHKTSRSKVEELNRRQSEGEGESERETKNVNFTNVVHLNADDDNLAPDELSLLDDDDSLSVNLIDGNQVDSFRCNCPLLTVDDQRRLYVERIKTANNWGHKGEKVASLLERPLSSAPESGLICAPNLAGQLQVFGALVRNSNLIKRLRRRPAHGRAVGQWSPSSTRNGINSSELSMYKLEALLGESNANLSAHLEELALESSLRLERIARLSWPHLAKSLFCSPAPESDGDNKKPDEAEFELHTAKPDLMIRAPVVFPKRGKLFFSTAANSIDSGVESFEEIQAFNLNQKVLRWKWRNGRTRGNNSGSIVEDSVKFRANFRVQSIVSESIQFFKKLLRSSPLFWSECEAKIDDGQQNGISSMSLQELKLNACVECQKLRSAIRFEWLTKCLLLAFEGDQHLAIQKGSNGRRAEQPEPAPKVGQERPKRRPRLEGEPSDLAARVLQPHEKLPPIGGPNYPIRKGKEEEEVGQKEEEEEEKYCDLLALLMGQLLRRHFLEEALELWLARLAKLLSPDRQSKLNSNSVSADPIPASQRAKIRLEVSLLEEESSQQAALACMQPKERLCETFGFVVDELALVCRKLPRLETLLECSQWSMLASADKKSAEISHHLTRVESGETCANAPKEAHISVLQMGDHLLANVKHKIHQLVDQTPELLADIRDADKGDDGNDFQRQEQRIVCKQRDWLDNDYLAVIELVNRFRLGDELGQLELQVIWNRFQASPQSDKQLPPPEQETNSQQSEQLRALRSASKQIGLLNQLELELKGFGNKLRRFHEFGLIQLDYAPLGNSLLRHIQKERLLLVRLNLDDQLKLMERLRLQFDDIELSIDLESAIEDYLAERWQTKQSQQPQLEQVILAGDGDDEEEGIVPANTETFLGDLFADLSSAAEQQQRLERDILERDKNLSGAARIELAVSKEDEEFLAALVGGNSGPGGAISPGAPGAGQGQLLALAGPLVSQLAQEEVLERKVAPLIECKLLVDRFSYLSELLAGELDQLRAELELAFAGLQFLAEFVAADELEPASWTSIRELAARSREFTPMLIDSLGRLEAARQRLILSNSSRSRVLNKLVLEFHLLMVALGQRRLNKNQARDGATSAPASAADDDRAGNDLANCELSRNIKQLDAIQETSNWSQKLELRCAFLKRQNELLARETKLLALARLSRLASNGTNNEPILASQLDDADVIERAQALDRWAPLAASAANLWRLSEEFETQQVKWLNSDLKQIDFAQVELIFGQFLKRLGDLRRANHLFASEGQLSSKKTESEFCKTLSWNLIELESKLNEFSRRRLPMFKFLTNIHLTELDWFKVGKLLESGGPKGSSPNSVQARTCTTLAQFVELGADLHLTELEEMNRRSVIEHELSLFLLAEATANLSHLEETSQRSLLRSLDLSGILANWSEQEFELAAARFIEAKLSQFKPASGIQLWPADGETSASNSMTSSKLASNQMAAKLVGCHSLVRRHLRLSYELNLEFGATKGIVNRKSTFGIGKQPMIALRSCALLSSAQLVRPAMFVELLRLFAQFWIKALAKYASHSQQLAHNLAKVEAHLNEIETLFKRIKQLHERDLKLAARDSERTLVSHEREMAKLELDREILATKEAMSFESQRKALGVRDDCIRQITERAIPAIRAAAKALDLLDGRSLRALRCLRPNPPEPIRLVVEAVCLLRSCVLAQSNSMMRQTRASPRPANPMVGPTVGLLLPERRFDAVKGRILEDYWPTASRMLNGCHSSRFLADLRRVDKRSIPNEVMRLIRGRYLSSSKFQVALIERVSRECALLARWLIAVDVFDRVINIVKPNYKHYMESERQLSELIAEVNGRRRQIELIGNELQQKEDLVQVKINHKMSLADSLDECMSQLKQVDITRSELVVKRDSYLLELNRLRRQQSRLANRCMLRAAQIVFINAMRPEEQSSILSQLKTYLSST